MDRKIRLAIMDDHQAIIDGYLYRLQYALDIEVIVTLSFAEDLGPALAKHPIDVLLLDVQVPISPSNANPFPILYELPRLLQIYPELSILVISMHSQPAMIRAILDAGASGYMLKDDVASFRELASVIRSIAAPGIYLSPATRRALQDRQGDDFNQPLSTRQLEALSLCAAYPDASTAELALRMNISHSTVRNLLSGSYLKLNVHNRTSAILKAQQIGLIIPGEMLK